MAASTYLTTLTPLRGIAALLVVVFHSNLMNKKFLPDGYTSLVDMSWLWVDFFFVLSGFIMSYVYSSNFKSGTASGKYWKYMRARFARVYPLHLFTMIWALIASLFILHFAAGLDVFFESMFTPWAVPTSLLLIQGMHIHMTAPLNTPSWSLSTEWWMYMIFPFLVPSFIKFLWPARIIVLIIITAGYLAIMYILGPMAQPFPGGGPTLDVVADFGFLRCAAGFVLGMIVHDIYQERAGFQFLSKDWIFVLLFMITLLGMHFGINALLIVLMFPLIILSAAYNSTAMKKILDTKPLQRLGDWSFSIYMVHVPIIYFFWIRDVSNNPYYFKDLMELITAPADYMGGLIRLAIVLPATLLMAAFTYRYLEIPAREYLNRVGGTKR